MTSKTAIVVTFVIAAALLTVGAFALERDIAMLGQEPGATTQHFAAMLLALLLLWWWSPLLSRWRASTMFLVVFAAWVVNIQIEASFFITMTDGQRLAMLAMQTARTVAVVAVVLLAVPAAVSTDAPVALLSERSALNWLLRLVLAALAYVALYVVVGAAAYTYTRPYYESMTNGLGLTVPDMRVVLGLQVARGLVYAGAALAYCAATDRRRGAALILGALLAGFGGVIPLIDNVAWPLPLRVYHLIEIVFQNLPFGLIAYALFRTSKAAR